MDKHTLALLPQALTERGRALPGPRLPGIESTNISVRVRVQNEKSVGFQILPVEIYLKKLKKKRKEKKGFIPGEIKIAISAGRTLNHVSADRNFNFYREK